MRRWLILLIALALLPLSGALGAETGAPAGRHAARLIIDGPIGPATADYFSRSLDKALKGGASVIILQMDTPGGLDASMREIIQAILKSPVPVIGYVAPNGARAASAGTYILYACNIAAMAPATNLGAATPVQLGGGSPLPEPEKGKNGEGAKEKPAGDAMTHKVINDAVAYIRSLAKLRGRNADWAEKAVREAASLDAKEALKQNVIDVIAPSTAQLLDSIDGRRVEVRGEAITLKTRDLPVYTIEPDWRSELLAVITNPNVAYILMLIGIYGLIFEFANPGTMVSGVIGAICLVVALFALQVLPINYAGLGLMLLGIGLMVGEAFVPSFGILGIGGVAAFVIGSVMLLDTSAPGFGISYGLIAGVALFSAGLFAVMMGMILHSRRRPVVSGTEEMIGSEATVLEDFEHQGLVRAHSELWKASTDRPVHKGDKVRIVAIEGLELKVTAEPDKGA